MARKKKNAAADNGEKAFPQKQIHPIHAVVQNAQINEAFHNKYIKELQQLYIKLGHDRTSSIIIGCLQQFMTKSAENCYANTALVFLAKFLTSFDTEDTNLLLVDCFDWLLNTISLNTTIRFRLCEFVNLILNSLGSEATLDDNICDNILKYMLERLKDTSPSVRVQAINALQRLQVPDNPNDPIVKVYQFHMSTDPSALVRKAVITAIGRNFHTIPIILERLWDVDATVRRHAYIQMSSYPVRTYKVSQRLTFLEQGLFDENVKVKKVVTGVLLPQWFESYNNDFISFISGLKLDANTSDMERFRKATKMALFELFRQQDDEKLIDVLGFEQDGDFKNCIPINKLNIETSLYWATLLEYFQENDEKCEKADLIIPELTLFCAYIKQYCSQIESGEIERWKQISYQYVLLTLSEILLKFDLGDEIGRQNLKLLLVHLVSNESIEHKTVENIARCVETLIPVTSDRMQFIVDVIRNVMNMNVSSSIIDFSDGSISTILDKDPDLKVKVTSLKLKILELEELKSDMIQRNDFISSAKNAEEINACNEQMTNLLRDALVTSGSSLYLSNILETRKVTNEMIVRCLQLAYFAVCSKCVQSLTPNMSKLYKDFIRPQIESTQMLIRDWALKCAGTFSMLYSQLAKDTYKEMYSQFFKHQNTQIWTTSIRTMYELIDLYGFEFFDDQDEGEKQKDKTIKTKSRQLFNTVDNLDPDEEATTGTGTGIGLMHLFDHFLSTCLEVSILSELVDGFCRLILRGHYTSKEMMSKLLLKFFNPKTDPVINQILGIFFETMVKTKKQEYLQPALLSTLFIIFEAHNESPLKEVKPETVIKFVINSTLPNHSSPGLNIHNTIAMSFLECMADHATNKDLLRVLSSAFRQLEISEDQSLRNDLKEGLTKLEELPLDAKTLECIKFFKLKLDGIEVSTIGTTLSSVAQTQNHGEDEENSDNNEMDHERDDLHDRDHNGNTEDNTNEPEDTNEENENHLESDKEQHENNEKREKSGNKTTNTSTIDGLENSTKLRYLRKSLHFRPNKGNEGMTGKYKIRVLSARNLDKKSNKKENQEPRKRKITESSQSSQSDTEDNSNTDSNIIPASALSVLLTPLSSTRKSFAKANEQSNEDVIEASPTHPIETRPSKKKQPPSNQDSNKTDSKNQREGLRKRNPQISYTNKPSSQGKESDKKENIKNAQKKIENAAENTEDSTKQLVPMRKSRRDSKTNLEKYATKNQNKTKESEIEKELNTAPNKAGTSETRQRGRPKSLSLNKNDETKIDSDKSTKTKQLKDSESKKNVISRSASGSMLTSSRQSSRNKRPLSMNSIPDRNKSVNIVNNNVVVDVSPAKQFKSAVNKQYTVKDLTSPMKSNQIATLNQTESIEKRNRSENKRKSKELVTSNPQTPRSPVTKRQKQLIKDNLQQPIDSMQKPKTPQNNLKSVKRLVNSEKSFKYGTRQAVVEEFVKSNIITRRKLSVDNIVNSVRVNISKLVFKNNEQRSLSADSRKNSQSNTPTASPSTSKSNKKMTENIESPKRMTDKNDKKTKNDVDDKSKNNDKKKKDQQSHESNRRVISLRSNDTKMTRSLKKK